jgi:hypothetical protein
LRVFLGRDPVTGKKRYATKTVRGGKREAQSALAAMITEAERGSMARTTATVGELLDAWFEFAAPDFSPKTVKETRGYIDRSLMSALGTRRLSKLKPADLDAFYRQLLASGGVSGRPLAPGTVRRIHGILLVMVQRSRLRTLSPADVLSRRSLWRVATTSPTIAVPLAIRVAVCSRRWPRSRRVVWMASLMASTSVLRVVVIDTVSSLSSCRIQSAAIWWRWSSMVPARIRPWAR